MKSMKSMKTLLTKVRQSVFGPSATDLMFTKLSSAAKTNLDVLVLIASDSFRSASARTVCLSKEETREAAVMSDALVRLIEARGIPTELVTGARQCGERTAESHVFLPGYDDHSRFEADVYASNSMKVGVLYSRWYQHEAAKV